MCFERNVFVNCPFDEAYQPLLHSLLFTIYYMGFQPRVALESRDSGRPRIEKIVKLIRESKYSIHDLSRVQSTAVGEFFRLNMPFELGVDFGCRTFMRGRYAQKRCLILGADRYLYQAALSDLSGSDIQSHGGNEQNMIREVRAWLNSHSETEASGPTRIWEDFSDFIEQTYNQLRGEGHSKNDIRLLGVDEFMRRMAAWQIARACAWPVSQRRRRGVSSSLKHRERRPPFRYRRPAAA